MWTTRLRYSGLGVLLVGVTVSLLIAWRLNHVLFGIAVGFICLVVTILLVARDGWRTVGTSCPVISPIKFNISITDIP